MVLRCPVCGLVFENTSFGRGNRIQLKKHLRDAHREYYRGITTNSGPSNFR